MNILTLSTYPIDVPMHGGQHRLSNVVSNYKKGGHTVHSVGVLGSDSYPPAKGFVSCPQVDALSRHIENPFLMEDFSIGELFSKEDAYFKVLAQNIETEPDVIHVEHPWLFGFAKRYVDLCSKKQVKILYGSPNIEYKLKHYNVSLYLGEKSATNAREKVLRCEMTAIMNADAICCVSEQDRLWTRKSTTKPCVLAPNGVAERVTTEAGIRGANAFSGGRKFALYCASAHPPNMAGFFEIFEKGVGCIAPNERIVVAGGVGSAIQGDKRFSKTAQLSSVFVSAGLVSEPCLQGFLETAHAIILPITQGEGTNLKTAEALWAGKHIIGTTPAFRGFEQFMSSEGVCIADEPSQFLAYVRQSMSAPPHALSLPERDRRKTLLWDNTLQPLLGLVSQMTGDKI